MSQNSNENLNNLKPINDELIDIFAIQTKNSQEKAVNPIIDRISFIGGALERARALEIAKATQNDRQE